PILAVLTLLSCFALRILAEPLSLPFTSCLSQHASSLAAPEQVINFTQLWAQIDTGQTSPGQLGDLRPGSLRATVVGDVIGQGSGYSSQTNFLATLITQTSVLSFQSFFNQSALCTSIRSPGFSSSQASPISNSSNSSLASNSGCPYGPGDVALGVSIPIHSGYPFTTLTTQLRILDTSTPALTLACVEFDATPYYPDLFYYKLLVWIPVGVALGYLLFCWTGRVWATIISVQLDREAQLASSISDPFVAESSWTSRFSAIWWQSWSGTGLLLSGALLRFSTPGVLDFISHLQFITSLGFFAVQWPEFIYPIISRVSWSTLIVNSTIIETKNLDNLNFRSNPLLVTQYDPPQKFVSQFDLPNSPLYLDRALPNNLLNLNTTDLGIKRWAVVVGLHDRDFFGISSSILALICAAIIIFSLVAFLIDLAVSLIRRSFGQDTVNKSHQQSSAVPGSNQSDGYDQVNKLSGVTGVTSEGGTSTDQSSWWLVNGQPSNGNKEFREKLPAIETYEATTDSLSLWPEWKFHLALLQGNLLRIFIMFHFPLIIFSSYQLTLVRTASIVSISIAGIILLICALIPLLQLYRLKRHSTEELIDNQIVALSLGPMYTKFADKSEMFMGVRFGCSLVVGIVIGVGQATGIAQAVVLLLTELVEIMITSLCVPWGEGAAMAPLAFVFSISRIITAVILVVLTPTVSVGSTAAGWLAYIILGLQGIVFLLFFLVLVSKILELFLRLFAHIPFDETRSSRAGGLRGAMRRWDRTSSRSTRHGRAAAIAARRRNKNGSKVAPLQSSQPVMKSLDAYSKNKMPAASGFTLGVNAVNSKDYGPHHQPYPSPSPSPGFAALNDEEGNIMSAMSQGPWIRAPGPDPIVNGFQRPSPYLVAPQISSNTESSPSSGFAVLRGGRASEKTPYLMHNDGRRTWHDNPRTRQHSAGVRDYPPVAHQAQISFSPPSDFNLISSSSGIQYQGTSKTTTNLFENTTFENSSSDVDEQSKDPGKKDKRRNVKKPFLGIGLFRREDGPNEGSSEEDDWDDTDEEEEEDDAKESSQNKIKDLVKGLGSWGRGKSRVLSTGSDESEHEASKASEPTQSNSGKAFEVVRQP
ncbi:hypothetical protein BY996DRAFT_8543175, partial [Phakopsora pachyrhizi]